MSRKVATWDRVDYESRPKTSEIISCPDCMESVAVKNGHFDRFDITDEGKWKKHKHQPKLMMFRCDITKIGGNFKLTRDDFRC